MAYNGKTPPPFPGRSLRPAFAKDHTVAHDYLFFHHLDNRALRAGDWKISSADKGGAWELYNMKNDRGEANNLAAKYPERVKEFAALWERAEARYKADNLQ